MKIPRIPVALIVLLLAGASSCETVGRNIEAFGDTLRPEAVVTVQSADGGDESSYRLIGTWDEHSRSAVEAIARQEWPSAIQELELAIEADPAEPRHYFFLGLIHEVQGDLEAAQENYDLAVEFGSMPRVEYTASQVRAQEKRGLSP